MRKPDPKLLAVAKELMKLRPSKRAEALALAEAKRSASKINSEPKPATASTRSQNPKPGTSRATDRLPQSEIESLREHFKTEMREMAKLLKKQ
ncbi:MAG: hypothetical protein V4633_17720 [Pseudomonadota bacterium]